MEWKLSSDSSTETHILLKSAFKTQEDASFDAPSCNYENT